MNSKTKQFQMFLLAGLLIVGLIALNGCKKSEPAPEGTSVEKMQEEPRKAGTQMQENMAMRAEPAIASSVEQTTCPVMGGAIDKALFTEYKGKKVYFCCPACKEKFDAEPEKYIAKLPQFSK